MGGTSLGLVTRSLVLLLLPVIASLQARPEDPQVAARIERQAPQVELARVARAIQSPVGELRVALAQQQPGQLIEPTGAEWQRRVRSPNPVDDDEYEEVEEDGPEGRHLHGIKRKIKRKLKHKLHHGLGAPGLLGGWQQPGYGPIAIANPGYGHHGPIGGGWRPPQQHFHQHQFGHPGGFGGGFGNGGWNPGFGGGGWRPGGPSASSSAQSWSFGPFQAAFAQSG